MKIFIILLLLITNLYSQNTKEILLNNKLDSNGDVVWYFQESKDEIFFIANIFSQDIYTFIYKYNGKEDIKFYFKLDKKNRFNIINISSQNYLECKEIKLNIIDNNTLELIFNCKKWNYKNIILSNKYDESKNKN